MTKLNRYYGINGADNPAIGVMTAITWAIACARDKGRSQIQGMNKWDRLTSCIINAASAAMTVDDYVGKFCQLVAASSLPPRMLSRIVAGDSTRPVILYWVPLDGEDPSAVADQAVEPLDLPQTLQRFPDGDVGVMQDQHYARLAYGNYRLLVQDACRRMPCEEYRLLDCCRDDSAYIITTLCQLKDAEFQAQGIKVEDEAIDVEVMV